MEPIIQDFNRGKQDIETTLHHILNEAHKHKQKYLVLPMTLCNSKPKSMKVYDILEICLNSIGSWLNVYKRTFPLKVFFVHKTPTAMEKGE